MALTLRMSGVACATRKAVEAALAAYAESHHRRFERLKVDPGSSGVLLIVDGMEGRQTIAYPGTFDRCDEISAFLSRKLSTPTFSLQICHEELWMYVLFVNGEAVDWFNPVPDNWVESPALEEWRKWRGNAEVIAANWPGLTPDGIDRYLTVWNLDNLKPVKAYPDDSYGLDCWQVADFMKRLGLAFPVDDDGNWRGNAYQFEFGS